MNFFVNHDRSPFEIAIELNFIKSTRLKTHHKLYASCLDMIAHVCHIAYKSFILLYIS